MIAWQYFHCSETADPISSSGSFFARLDVIIAEPGWWLNWIDKEWTGVVVSASAFRLTPRFDYEKTTATLATALFYPANKPWLHGALDVTGCFTALQQQRPLAPTLSVGSFRSYTGRLAGRQKNKKYKVITTMVIRPLNLWSPINDPSVCGTRGSGRAHSVCHPCNPISSLDRFWVI